MQHPSLRAFIGEDPKVPHLDHISVKLVDRCKIGLCSASKFAHNCEKSTFYLAKFECKGDRKERKIRCKKSCESNKISFILLLLLQNATLPCSRKKNDK